MSHIEHFHHEQRQQDLQKAVSDLQSAIAELGNAVSIPPLYKLALEEGFRRLQEAAKCA